MIAPTHISFAFFFSLFVTTISGYSLNLDWLVYPFIILGAILPDIDTPNSYIGKLFLPVSRFLEKNFGHRTLTHSFIGWLSVTLVLSPLYFWNKNYLIFFSLAYLSHLFLDMLNVRGVTFFWPNSTRDVFGRKNRMRAGSKFELALVGLFLTLTIFTLPLSKYGVKNSLSWLIGDHYSAVRLFLQTDKRAYLDFQAIEAKTRKPVAGKALILEAVGNSYFIIAFNGKVYTISNGGSVDFLSSQERIDYTELPEKQTILKKEYNDFSTLTKSLTPLTYIKGKIILPNNYQLISELPRFAKLSDDTIILNFVSAAEIADLRFKKTTSAEEAKILQDIEKANADFEKLKLKLYDDGLTPAGRKKMNIDYTKEPVYLEAVSKISRLNREYNTVKLQRNQSTKWLADLILVSE